MDLPRRSCAFFIPCLDFWYKDQWVITQFKRRERRTCRSLDQVKPKSKRIIIIYINKNRVQNLKEKYLVYLFTFLSLHWDTC